ncbi:MAG TPA: glycoside hydrolase family 65 protein [bacterium (Candidatus Stahlbacteria)]|nr:glycoside hydrolase family 65 protein [Candidatus Stahlbacteria bacterium]
MLPFFIYTDHKAARALLMYRYNMLDGARKNAKLNGYRGAQFPWESTDDGTETIPKEVGNPFDKTFRVYEGEEEHHVIADIAYAVDHYYQATQDKEFMLNYGLEILFETARFWASRVEFDKVRKKYVIKRVIGPDEIHYHCDNSAFTNFMAKWNLERAATYAEEFKSCDAVKKLGVTTDEITSWYEIADKILIPYDKQSGIYEQFDGYFDLEEVKLEWPATDSYRVRTNIPIIPDKWRDWQKLMKTKLIKQPDVVLLLYLFREQFSTDEKKVNFDFYNPYTTYRSSLSASISSIIANETGYQDLAYRYFLMSARVGLDDIYKNTEHGFHAAAAGGTWQAVVNGFAGMRIHNDRLDFDPRLPREWHKLSFTIIWRGKPISIEITPTTFTVWSKSEKLDAEVKISVRNTLVKVKREKQTLRLNS